MASGKQTFNKSEREKRKRKERKEKKERSEERKANNNKGKSLEDMMAYVDEYGRLTSTPPDPAKRISIKAEDIQINISRQVESEDVDEERKGIISFFNESKGYGFIKEIGSQESFFLHISQAAQLPKEGDKVSFKVERGDRGLTAVEVKFGI